MIKDSGKSFPWIQITRDRKRKKEKEDLNEDGEAGKNLTKNEHCKRKGGRIKSRDRNLQ